jgi:hypothetical protein
MRLLEKEPDRRYQSAEGPAHDLTRLCAALARGKHGSFPLCERDFPRQLATPRLIGRGPEFETIRRAFEAAAQGDGDGDGGGILVAGAPGVGKTALIEELRPIVTARCGWFVYSKVDQFRHDAAAEPISKLPTAWAACCLPSRRQRLPWSGLVSSRRSATMREWRPRWRRSL